MSYFLLCISVLLAILVIMVSAESRKYKRESSSKSSTQSCNKSRQYSKYSKYSQSPKYPQSKCLQYDGYEAKADVIAKLKKEGIKPGTIRRAQETTPKNLPKSKPSK